MSFTSIYDTLNARLAAMADRPPVAWPNIDYTPTVGTLYLQPQLFPAATETTTLTSQGRHAGIYQVDVYAPIDVGTNIADAMADKIADHFAADRNLSGIRIRQVSWSSGIRDGAWYQIPVTINYDTHLSR